MCSPAEDHFDILSSRYGTISTRRRRTVRVETVGSYLQNYRSTRCPQFRYGELPLQGFLSGGDTPRPGRISNLAGNRGIRCSCHLSKRELLILFLLTLDYHGCHQEGVSLLRRIMGRGCIALPIIVGLYDAQVRYLIGGFRAD